MSRRFLAKTGAAAVVAGAALAVGVTGATSAQAATAHRVGNVEYFYYGQCMSQAQYYWHLAPGTYFCEPNYAEGKLWGPGGYYSYRYDLWAYS